MKSIQDFLMGLSIMLLIIGGYICIPEGHYERTIIGEDLPAELAEVYSEHVIDYPTRNQYLFGGSLIGIALLLGGGVIIIANRKVLQP